MLLSDHPRAHYRNAPVHEVICQLRFPPILTINQTEPAAFQDAVRNVFPGYLRKEDVPAPKISNGRLEQQPPVTNYYFLTESGKWKLNLTQNFIALSCLAYPGWEEFARMLDRPLATFIELYHPAFFLRVGLRYVNFFSKTRLGLEDLRWNDLFQSAYLGALDEDDIAEDDILSCGSDFLIKLDSSCHAKIHAGPGKIKNTQPGAAQDPETKFILDMDLFMATNTPCTLSAAALETLHGHGTRLFEGAVTERLREAMDPE